MIGFLSLFGLLVSISSIRAGYNGPFVMWGRDELSQAKVNPMSELDDKFLRDIYSDSSAIILFVRNASSHLKEENFPIFKDLLSKTNYIYLAQQHLGLDPMEFNLNAEVINLVGPISQQDVELSALYRDAVITYGEGKVLGILTSRSNDHEIKKRQVTEEPKPDISTETAQTDFVYYPNTANTGQKKILLYTSSPPIISNDTTILSTLNDVVTNKTVTITTDSRGEQRSLKTVYNRKDKLSIEYVFNISGDYWKLVAANIDWPTHPEINGSLALVGDQPATPLGFSYKCSIPLTFRKDGIYLELANIQVQLEANARRFNDSYDCIGFTSAPIWSGVFISFIICFAVALGLNCIMEIKPPNRFENSRGKQLTFTIQE